MIIESVCCMLFVAFLPPKKRSMEPETKHRSTPQQKRRSGATVPVVVAYTSMVLSLVSYYLGGLSEMGHCKTLPPIGPWLRGIVRPLEGEKKTPLKTNMAGWKSPVLLGDRSSHGWFSIVHVSFQGCSLQRGQLFCAQKK